MCPYLSPGSQPCQGTETALRKVLNDIGLNNDSGKIFILVFLISFQCHFWHVDHAQVKTAALFKFKSNFQPLSQKAIDQSIESDVTLGVYSTSRSGSAPNFPPHTRLCKVPQTSWIFQTSSDTQISHYHIIWAYLFASITALSLYVISMCGKFIFLSVGTHHKTTPLYYFGMGMEPDKAND